ncbi:MAG: folylpolyglutamate synthase/dihydrofolate synthase family protein [Eubacteriales bacterium]|nr:folylpolyglutamate synthase/dihydrofolate synthase family protein [Eubacteriales bacterium]
MTYQQAIDWINTRSWSGTGQGIVRCRALLALLGDPQKKLKFVHVAGTNGKGSVCACLARILEEAGYRTGLYVSPHLVRFNDRIYVDGKEIGDEDFARLAGQVRGAVLRMEEPATVFEIMTAMAMLYFREQGCDIVVLEVGMGGRLDSTNVIDAPEAGVITSIGLDHTKELGDTLEKIAREKGGIIKTGCPVVTDGGNGPVLPVLEEICREKGAFLTVTQPNRIRLRSLEPGRTEFDYGGLERVRLALPGAYQVRNAAVVIETARVLEKKGWRTGEETVRRGLLRVYWPGRFEILHRSPWFILDGSHNPDGIRATLESLREYFPGKKPAFLLGMLSTKDVEGALHAIEPVASEIGVIMPPSDKAEDAAALRDRIRRECSVRTESFSSIREGVERMLARAGAEDVICATGSLYSVAELRACAEHFFGDGLQRGTVR